MTDDLIEKLLADEKLAESYSTPVKMQNEQNAIRNERWRGIALAQRDLIEEQKSHLKKLEDFYYLISTSYNEGCSGEQIKTICMLLLNQEYPSYEMLKWAETKIKSIEENK